MFEINHHPRVKYITFEAHSLTKNLLEKPGVSTIGHSIYSIVRAHNRLRDSVRQAALKRRQEGQPKVGGRDVGLETET